MIDMLTEDDNLYSGRFVDWTPDDSASLDTVGSIGIKNVFKYEPPRTSPGHTKQEPVNFKNQKSNRRWRIINNVGTMYVPYSKVKTIHIWTFSRGSYLNIWVNDPNEEERMKWYLLLAAKRLDFFKEIKINVNVKEQRDQDNFLENFENWILENKLDDLPTKIDLKIFIES